MTELIGCKRLSLLCIYIIIHNSVHTVALTQNLSLDMIPPCNFPPHPTLNGPMVLQNLLTGPEITGSVPPQKKLVGRQVLKIEHIQNLDLIKANSTSQQIPAHCI